MMAFTIPYKTDRNKQILVHALHNTQPLKPEVKPKQKLKYGLRPAVTNQDYQDTKTVTMSTSTRSSARIAAKPARSYKEESDTEEIVAVATEEVAAPPPAVKKSARKSPLTAAKVEDMKLELAMHEATAALYALRSARASTHIAASMLAETEIKHAKKAVILRKALELGVSDRDKEAKAAGDALATERLKIEAERTKTVLTAVREKLYDGLKAFCTEEGFDPASIFTSPKCWNILNIKSCRLLREIPEGGSMDNNAQIDSLYTFASAYKKDDTVPELVTQYGGLYNKLASFCKRLGDYIGAETVQDISMVWDRLFEEAHRNNFLHILNGWGGAGGWECTHVLIFHVANTYKKT